MFVCVLRVVCVCAFVFAVVLYVRFLLVGWLMYVRFGLFVLCGLHVCVC